VAEKDFVVKNGIVVNSAFAANSTQITLSTINATSVGTKVTNSVFTVGNSSVNTTVNSTSLAFANSSNNYVINSTSLSSLVSAGVNTSAQYTWLNTHNFSVGFTAGANVVANTSALFFGNSSVNAVVNSTGLYVNGAAFSSGGGYYKGNQGSVGSASNANNLFRINANTMSNNVTIAAGENAQVTGPVTISTGYTLSIQTGGRVVVI
jgi:hypothetical protein